MNLNGLMKIGITAIVLLGIFGIPLVSSADVQTGTTDMNATVSVWVDITPSSALAYGVLFGSVDPGTINNRAQNDTTGPGALTDYNITVDTSSNVVVDLYNNVIGNLGDIAPDNVTIEANQTIDGVNINITDATFTNETNQMNLSTTYRIIGNDTVGGEGPCADVSPGANCYILYWLDVPSATSSGAKETTYRYCGVQLDQGSGSC